MRAPVREGRSKRHRGACFDVEGKQVHETHFEPNEYFHPSISAEMVTIAVHTCGLHGTCVDGVNSYSCECDPQFQEMDIDGDQMRPITGCELSVWKSSVCERGDRLVIKQFPALTEARSCPGMTITYSSIELVGPERNTMMRFERSSHKARGFSDASFTVRSVPDSLGCTHVHEQDRRCWEKQNTQIVVYIHKKRKHVNKLFS